MLSRKVRRAMMPGGLFSCARWEASMRLIAFLAITLAAAWLSSQLWASLMVASGYRLSGEREFHLLLGAALGIEPGALLAIVVLRRK
jgi:hypothetical protein